jgi:uncharacterized protein
MNGKCPICGALRKDIDKYFPFCSERCKLVDLGRWLDEEYSFPIESETEDG